MKNNIESQRAAAHDTEPTDEDMEFIKKRFADEPANESATSTPTKEEVISDKERERMAREAEVLANEEAERGAELPED